MARALAPARKDSDAAPRRRAYGIWRGIRKLTDPI